MISDIRHFFQAHRKEGIALLCLFVFSRIAIALAGVHFDADVIVHGQWQLISAELLDRKLLESLWYLHSQPPFYNLYAGIIVKVFPSHYGIVFHGIHVCIGITSTLLLYFILFKIKIRNSIALVISILFTISPATLLYETWLSYTYFIVFILLGSTLFLLYFIETKKWKYGFTFFSLLSILVLTRSMYHLVWIVAILSMLALFKFVSFKTLFRSSVIPFTLALAWYVKNYILFGIFASSSWFGMSLSEIILAKLPYEKKKQLIEGGLTSALVKKEAFWSIDHYQAFLSEENPYPNIQVLTDTVNGKHANLHHFGYIELSQKFQKDALIAVKEYPFDYLKNVVIAFGYYFHPTSNHYDLRSNRQSLFTYNKYFNHLILGCVINPDELELDPPFQPKYLLTTSFFVVIAYALCGLILLLHFISQWKQGHWNNGPLQATLLFSLLTLSYVMIIGNFFEQGENMRFRYETIIPSLILLAFCVQQIVDSWSVRKQRINQ
jgi:hypothetical protein